MLTQLEAVMFGNDEMFEALANVRRRRLLVGLLYHDPQPVPELTGEDRKLLGANESLLDELLDRPRGSTSDDTALVQLYHVHLPMLAENGFIEWQRDAHVVTKGPQFDDLEPLLRLLDAHRVDPPAMETVVPPRS